jgi:hypothetical protein
LVSLTRLALLIRVFLAIVIFYGPWDRYALGEDQYGYDFYPQVISEYWSGNLLLPPMFMADDAVRSRIGYYNFVTLQYYLLSPSFMIPRLLNCLAGALIVFYAYRLATLVFGRLEGRVAAVWTTLFPSLILWSTVNLRDIWLALSVLVIVYHSMELRERFNLTSIATIIAHLIWIQYNRSYLVMIMIGGIIGVFAFARTKRLGRDFLVGGLLVALFMTLHYGFGLGRDGFEWLDLGKVSIQREKLARANVGESGYLGSLSLQNPTVLVTFFPLLLAYFLFSPFPWQMTAFRRLITLPEMVFWYWLIPFVWIAARTAVRERISQHLALLLPVLVITVAFALPAANVGLAYRYRAQVIGLLLPFAAAGYVSRRVPSLARQTAAARA